MPGAGLCRPPTWQRIDLDPATVAASIEAAGITDPNMQSGYVTNVNVIHSQLPFAVPLATVIQISVAQLENIPSFSGPITHHPVSVAAGQGEQFNYHLRLSGRSVSVTQYLFVGARRANSVRQTGGDQ